MAFAPASRGRLTRYDLDRFPDDTLFDRLARAVCRAECLPRKELYEAWELARRTRRLFRGGRIVDLAGGHGLLAHVLLLLDDSSTDAVVVDTSFPASAVRVQEVLVETWPRLANRVTFRESDVADVTLGTGDVVVSCHACGTLTDRILSSAASARARLAVLPCCHDLTASDDAGLSGWMDGSLAIDAARALRLREQGYRIWTQTIPEAITPKNRLLLGEPRVEAGLASRNEGRRRKGAAQPLRNASRLPFTFWQG
jgi:hypothetical protein